MKRYPVVALLPVVSLLSALTTVGIAGATDFPQHLAAVQLSASRGFTQRTLATQQRVAPGSATVIGRTLVAALCGGACGQQTFTQKASAVQATGSGWSLDVSADGSSARFENIALERQGLAMAKDPSQALTAPALEASGRKLIAAKLASAIVLGPQEQLVPLHTDYLIGGGESLQTHTVKRYVLANRIVFGRTIAGVPVVGGGSTVVLTFANNGALESLRYDWPVYRPAAAQGLASLPQLVGRINAVIGARQSGAAMPADAKKISGKITADAPVGKSGTALQKLECGLFDPGVAARAQNTAIQPGCVYHVVRRDTDGMRQGFAGAVPAGVAFTRDPGWAETLVLSPRP